MIISYPTERAAGGEREGEKMDVWKDARVSKS